jgi:hypothetical protein
LILIEDQSFLARFVKGFGNNAAIAQKLPVAAANSSKPALSSSRQWCYFGNANP